MAFTFIKDINYYVQEHYDNQADSLKVNLDEGTFTVTVFPVDTNDNQVAGSSDIINKTFSDLSSAVSYYGKMVEQLREGDFIRNV